MVQTLRTNCHHTLVILYKLLEEKDCLAPLDWRNVKYINEICQEQ